MYIRTTKTHTKGGKPAYSYRLVEAVREGQKVRQKTRLNLGIDYAFPKDQWKTIATRTRDLLNGQVSLVAVAPEIQAEAERLVTILRARGTGPALPEAEFTSVDLDSLDHDGSVSVGCERVCLKALEDLGVQTLLQTLGVSDGDARIAIALLIAKMVHPSSEREACRWLNRDSATLELLGLDTGKGVSLTRLYRINDLLWKHREALLKGLFAREHQLLDIADTVVFYDLSNTYYTGQRKGSLLSFGRSKEKRSDCPLATMGLVLDAAGFPRGCEILPGNVSEPGTLKEALQKFEAVCAGIAKKPTVILDAGIATRQNLAWLEAQGYDWVCVSRGRKPSPPRGPEDILLTTTAGHEVRAWQLEDEGSEARLYAVSSGKKQTGQDILARARGKFEAALERLHDGLSIRGRLKGHDKILQSIGRLQERYPGVSRQYDVKVTRGQGGNATAVTFKRNKHYEESDANAGSYVLRTSHRDWSLEKVLQTYWRLTEIEATFRSLKSELNLRPIWHRLDRRISAHLLISVLAYHGVHLIRTRLKGHGYGLSWDSIRTCMRPLVRVTTTLREASGALLVNRQDVRPGAEMAAIMKASGVAFGIHRHRSRVGADKQDHTDQPDPGSGQDSILQTE